MPNNELDRSRIRELEDRLQALDGLPALDWLAFGDVLHVEDVERRLAALGQPAPLDRYGVREAVAMPYRIDEAADRVTALEEAL